jgi:hypothetical protein
LLALPLQRSGFNRFYQHLRWKILIPGKTFRAKKERPGTMPGPLEGFRKLSCDDDDGGDGDATWHSREQLTQPERRVQWQQGKTRAAS